MERMRLEIHGRVQGVGFRWFTRERARRWGLRGWVMNRPDGTVELVAEGPRESLDGLRADVRRGPPGAFVDEVRQLPVEGNGDALPEPFTVVR